jgi:hypothetical protein
MEFATNGMVEATRRRTGQTMGYTGYDSATSPVSHSSHLLCHWAHSHIMHLSLSVIGMLTFKPSSESRPQYRGQATESVVDGRTTYIFKTSQRIKRMIANQVAIWLLVHTHS